MVIIRPVHYGYFGTNQKCPASLSRFLMFQVSSCDKAVFETIKMCGLCKLISHSKDLATFHYHHSAFIQPPTIAYTPAYQYSYGITQEQQKIGITYIYF